MQIFLISSKLTQDLRPTTTSFGLLIILMLLRDLLSPATERLESRQQALLLILTLWEEQLRGPESLPLLYEIISGLIPPVGASVWLFRMIPVTLQPESIRLPILRVTNG